MEMSKKIHQELPLVQHVKEAQTMAWYKKGRLIKAAGKDSAGYQYTLAEPPGKHFAPEFKPEQTPAQMLSQGVFEGKYLNDSWSEFPREWFENALQKDKLRAIADPHINAFKIKSRLSLGEWRRRGWIPALRDEHGNSLDPDVRGWFQWYCRYWIGRRIPELDAVQIARWRAFTRHRGQILASYKRLKAARQPIPQSRDEKRQHRAKQRQALLQWAYDPWV